MWNYAELCIIMQNYAELCRNMQNYAKLCRIMHNYAELCRIMQNYVELCTIMRNYASILRNYAKFCGIINITWYRICIRKLTPNQNYIFQFNSKSFPRNFNSIQKLILRRQFNSIRVNSIQFAQP